MDSPGAGSTEEMEVGKRRRILDRVELDDKEEVIMVEADEWADPEPKHRSSKSRQSRMGDADSRGLAGRGRGRGYREGEEERFMEGNGENSEEERASAEGGRKRGERTHTSWDGAEEALSNFKRKASRDRRSARLERDRESKERSIEKEDVRWPLFKEDRVGSETSGREGAHPEVVGSRSSGSSKKKSIRARAGKASEGMDAVEDIRMVRREGGNEDAEEDTGKRVSGVDFGGRDTIRKGERDKELEGEVSGGRGGAADWYNSEIKRSGNVESRGGRREREEVGEWYDGEEGDTADAKWVAFEDFRRGSSGKVSDRGDDRVGRRGTRGREKGGGSGDRNDISKENASDLSSRGRKKSDQRKVGSRWDDPEEGKSCGRGKRSREDDERERSRGRERGDGTQEDSDEGTRVPGRRGEDAKGYRSHARNSGVEDWSEGKQGKGDEDWVEKPATLDVSEEGGRFSGKGRGERETERGDKHRQKLLRERAEANLDVADYGGRHIGRNRGSDERHENLKVREGSEDGGRGGGRSRGGKSVKEPWTPDGMKGRHGDWDDTDRDWVEDEDFEHERNSGRSERERERQRYFERDNDGPREREKVREWEEVAERHNERHRDRFRDGDDTGREAGDLDRKRDRAERERSGRERMERGMYDRERLERERGESLTGPNGMVLMNDNNGRGGPLPLGIDPGRGILSGGMFLPRMGGDSGGGQGEFMGGGGEVDWEGSMQEERARMGESNYSNNRVRHTNEDEPPPGLDQAFGPSTGRGGGNDGGMGFNLHAGRGRSKFSPNNRSRGAMVLHENPRPMFVNNQGAGMMMRGMQPGGKGGRGGRGPGKAGRGGGRDGQRSNVTVISQMGPGLAGPHFGQLGPPGPMTGHGPGIMGPGGFPLPPFGNRMGWNGGGDMGMMNGPPGPGPGPGPVPVPGPPRFVQGMGPGPPSLGPNMFFPSPGGPVVRGGPGAIVPGGPFAGGAPFGGGRPMPGDNRGPSGGWNAARGGGPAGRGPSRGEQNDYSQHFVDTGLRPQNFIRDVDLADRFEEYPKLKELIARKDKLIGERATPPMYMQCDLRTTELRPEVFGTKFDVILVDPPWEEYVRRAPGVGDAMEWWSYADIQSLRIDAIADTPAFLFLWVGDAEGLDKGRLCLKKWGFRRCEDICWVKTNRENPTPALRHDANTVLQHSKEHCLMGIRGTVRRSTDGHIIHANVDTDIIISEEPDYGSTAKPEELYHIIEHFAQGQRRIELFGEDHNIRAGWVTVGKGLSSSNFSPQTYAKHFVDSDGKLWQGGRGNPPFDAPHLVGTTSEIESLRPKSPPPRPHQQPPPQVVNCGQPSGTTGSVKRTPGIVQGGPQNGPLVPSLAPGAGLGTLPVETGKAASHGQNFKPLESTVSTDKVDNEERSLGTEVIEPSGEVEVAGKADLSKPVQL